MFPAGFELVTLEIKRPQTYASNRMATVKFRVTNSALMAAKLIKHNCLKCFCPLCITNTCRNMCFVAGGSVALNTMQIVLLLSCTL
jgi:hypothetical protein